MNAHTPTPWEFDHNDSFPGFRILESGRPLYDHIATLQGTMAKADAKFIVRAVNSHEALLEAANKFGEIAKDTNYMTPELWSLWEKVQAIAQAEGAVI